jgi:cold-inducible RNA-binding protein
MSTKLFVGNLSFNTTENEIQEAFAAHGTVVEANLMMDRMSGRSRGFAFVTMSTPEEAQKAIEAMNGATLGERALTVNIARPKEERPRGRAAIAVRVVNTAVAAVAAAAVAAVVAAAVAVVTVLLIFEQHSTGGVLKRTSLDSFCREDF